MSATSAGGPAPPAGGAGTLQDLAASDLRAQTEVVRAARAWRRSHPHERITVTVDEDQALLYAIDHFEAIRSKLYAALHAGAGR